MGIGLREARQKRGLSMEQVARETGLSVRTVYRAEKGQDSRADTLRAIAGVLGLRVVLRFEDPSTVDGEADFAHAQPVNGLGVPDDVGEAA
jgi:transcriptional regulator with XRE-family HTH domain